MATVPTPLRDIAKVVRSKNAGPFEITLDIVFKTKEDFEAVKKSGVITKELVSELYNVPTQAIITFGFFDLVNAVKITLPRPRPQGGIGETDMHAAQQHVPLQEIRVPWPVQQLGRDRPACPPGQRRSARPCGSRLGAGLAVAADQAGGALRAGRRLGLHLAAGRREDVGAARPDHAGRQQARRRRQSRRRNSDQVAARRLHLPDDLGQLRDQLDPAQAVVQFAERHRGDRPVHRRADRAVRPSRRAGAHAEGAGRALPARARQGHLRLERTGRAGPSRHRVLPRRRRHQGDACALSRHGAGAERPDRAATCRC